MLYTGGRSTKLVTNLFVLPMARFHGAVREGGLRLSALCNAISSKFFA